MRVSTKLLKLLDQRPSFSSGVAKLLGSKSGASGGHCPRGKSVAENDTNTEENSGKKGQRGTSLVAQWLRIRLPMQGTQVRALVREDPTCCGATKPVHRNY